MEDRQIIDLYRNRDETAITETEDKYGAFCRKIAGNILTLREDAEECVNDTWLTAWNRIPPVIPRSLRAFLGRIVRDISLSRWRSSHAQKRYSGMDVLLSELEECVPAPQTVEGELESAELGRVISRWLRSLPEEDRTLFIRRYWNGEAVKDLAELAGCTQNQMAQRMYRLRLALKTALEKEEITL